MLVKNKNGLDKNLFAATLDKYCRYLGVSELKQLNQQQWYQVISQTVLDLSYQSVQPIKSDKRHVNYLSMEFLVGRLTGNNLLNLGWYESIAEYLKQYQIELSDILEEERDPALGNGGLGRLAACYLDSMASIEQPATGYGLNYQYGLFKQLFDGNRQIEQGDSWSRDQYPWLFHNMGCTRSIGFWGKVVVLENGRKEWHPALRISGSAFDLPIYGYKNNVIQALRLWQAENEQSFDLAMFNEGNYLSAEHGVVNASVLTKVLYPNDNHQNGKQLRLMQQYFHCACAIADILDRHLREGYALMDLPKYQVIQLNDTHPALAIPELMRVLMDEYLLDWASAWSICNRTFAYTNHTLLPEALEQWDQRLLQHLLPRHFQILDQLNADLHQQIIRTFGDDAKIWEKTAILFDHQVRMANLCVVGSFAVNGVAQIHSDLVVSDLFPEFNQLYPSKFCNVTNGVTPRRWIRLANPELAQLLDQHIDGDWTQDLSKLSEIESYADDALFQEKYFQIKQKNKQLLANEIFSITGIKVDTNAIFDIQVKRIHEYKRQHLNLLNIIYTYQQLKANPEMDYYPRVFIFSGKAAPGYYLAKNIIHAINRVAEIINHDELIKGKLKVVFLPDYRVSLAEKIIPAADVSEQISMAGKEASGTGNMKLALNGALTIGTLDGANVEIAELVGDENIFIFGHTVESIRTLIQNGYNPQTYYKNSIALKAAIDFLTSKEVCGEDKAKFKMTLDSLLERDSFLVLADFESYIEKQKQVSEHYKNRSAWVKSAILNTARLGKFSSDRSIRDYQRQIWKKSVN